MPPLTGEEKQLLGAEGAARARRWLDSTCRAEVRWTNPTINKKKLQYRKKSAKDDSEKPEDWFSFDLGGFITGGNEAGDIFLAEVKKVKHTGKQGEQYREFVAQAYCVESLPGSNIDLYLWITWTPFLVESWADLSSAAFVHETIESNPRLSDIAIGSGQIDDTLCKLTASKLATVVLCDRQLTTLALAEPELTRVRQALVEIRSDHD